MCDVCDGWRACVQFVAMTTVSHNQYTITCRK